MTLLDYIIRTIELGGISLAFLVGWYFLLAAVMPLRVKRQKEM